MPVHGGTMAVEKGCFGQTHDPILSNISRLNGKRKRTSMTARFRLPFHLYIGLVPDWEGGQFLRFRKLLL